MTQQTTSPGDLMKFLEEFRLSIENKIVDTKNSIEETNTKIDARMNRIDEDVNYLKEKLNENDDKIKDTAIRMDKRLTKLENEMRKSDKLRRQSEELRQLNKDLSNNSTVTASGSTILRLDTEPTAAEKTMNTRRTQSEKVIKVTNEILEEPVGTFRSTWARNIQAELEKAANLANTSRVDSSDHTKVNTDKRKNDVTKVPTNWDEDADDDDTREKPSLMDQFHLRKTKTPKVRKPPQQITDWFGLDSTDSSDTDFDQSSWTSIDKKKIQEDRRRRRNKRKEQLKSECSMRASSMVSIGPIPTTSIEYFMNDGVDFEQAKKMAVKELLSYSLNFDDTELEALNIMETKISNKGDNIVNVAFATENEARELYVRKAELQNSEITLRNYIPPNFYERFMHLNQICTQKRSEDPELRTQLRFGRKDIEVYIKIKSEETGFRKISLEQFTATQIPPFNPEIKWRKYTDRLPRKISSRQAETRTRPSMAGHTLPGSINNKLQTRTDTSEGQLVRSNSNTYVSQTKRKCVRAQSSSEDDKMSGSPSSQESDMENFVTPNARS